MSSLCISVKYELKRISLFTQRPEECVLYKALVDVVTRPVFKHTLLNVTEIHTGEQALEEQRPVFFPGVRIGFRMGGAPG